jgi:hypothetical protein
MMKVSLSRKQAAASLLAVVALAFILSSSVQVPARTQLRIVFAPQIPDNLASTDLSVLSRPRYPLYIIPSGGVMSPLSWDPLISYSMSRLRPTAVLGDGVVFDIVDPHLSAGAKRVQELRASLFAINDFTFELDGVYGEQPGEDVDCSPQGRRRVRPHREWNRAPDEPLRISANVSICRDHENTVVVDDSPLVFLSPEPSWAAYFTMATELPYSNFVSRARLGGAELPFAGADLKYSLEDELTGVSYPHPEALEVTAKVVEGDDLTDVSPTCRKWAGKLTKACWREFAALANGPSCSKIWPVALDRQNRVVHVDFIGTPGHGCSLLLGVVAPEGDSMHAMLVDLWAPKDPRSP